MSMTSLRLASNLNSPASSIQVVRHESLGIWHLMAILDRQMYLFARAAVKIYHRLVLD
jgi:hypothetical protein